MTDRRTIVMVAEIHPDDFAEFVDLEDQSIGIFGQFGLVLRHRFRDTDRATEVQVIDVPGEAALDRYVAAPLRVELTARFDVLRITQSVLWVDDVVQP